MPSCYASLSFLTLFNECSSEISYAMNKNFLLKMYKNMVSIQMLRELGNKFSFMLSKGSPQKISLHENDTFLVIMFFYLNQQVDIYYLDKVQENLNKINLPLSFRLIDYIFCHNRLFVLLLNDSQLFLFCIDFSIQTAKLFSFKHFSTFNNFSLRFINPYIFLFNEYLCLRFQFDLDNTFNFQFSPISLVYLKNHFKLAISPVDFQDMTIGLFSDKPIIYKDNEALIFDLGNSIYTIFNYNSMIFLPFVCRSKIMNISLFQDSLVIITRESNALNLAIFNSFNYETGISKILKIEINRHFSLLKAQTESLFKDSKNFDFLYF